MTTIETVNELLVQAAARLNDAMKQIATHPLPSRQSKLARLGAAQVEIFEAQYELWALKPDLLPPVVRGPSENPQSALESAMNRAKRYLSEGAVEAAIGVFDIFILYETSPQHLKLARNERARLINGQHA